MLATLRYVLIIAVRDRFVLAIGLAMLAALGVAMLMGASAIAEQRAMAQAYAGELIRFILTFGLITFVCFHVRRMHDTREIEAILARPISRAVFVLAYFLAFAAIALLMAFLASPLMIIGTQAGGWGLAEWEASLALESLIVVALALFAAMTLESATAAVIAALGLYLLGRAAAYFRAIADTHAAVTDVRPFNGGAQRLMDILALIAPRLDLFGQSRWLVYGPGGGWGISELLLQAMIYVPLLLLATIRDLQIRRF